MKKTVLIFIGIFLSISASYAKIKLPSIIGDNMVLQQKADVNIWGEAQKSAAITIRCSWNDKVYKTTSTIEGKWIQKIETPTAGGPYSITISDGEEMTLSNILIGEVWICSGQSNMEMPVKGYRGQPVNGSLDAIAQANPDNRIRLITLKTNSSQTPLEDCIATPWMQSTPQSVADFSATAYFFGQYLQKILNVPVGLICTSWGGSKIESWIDKKTFENEFPEISLDVLNKKAEEIKRPKDETTLLYNAMIFPIEKYTIQGAIWYQGESNRDNPDQYKRLFPAMVKSWRKNWGQGEFPFYYVQIAPYCDGSKNCEEIKAAYLRQVQLECMTAIPNSGMVVTADIGHPTCIHPPQKDLVGKRLALWALAKTYNREGTPYCGPIYRTITTNNEKIIVEFNFSELGMTSYDQDITGFEIAGSDNIFYPAKARLIENKTKVELISEQVKNPVHIRYGYKNYSPLNLYSNLGLPASPFTASK